MENKKPFQILCFPAEMLYVEQHMMLTRLTATPLQMPVDSNNTQGCRSYRSLSGLLRRTEPPIIVQLSLSATPRSAKEVIEPIPNNAIPSANCRAAWSVHTQPAFTKNRVITEATVPSWPGRPVNAGMTLTDKLLFIGDSELTTLLPTHNRKEVWKEQIQSGAGTPTLHHPFSLLTRKKTTPSAQADIERVFHFLVVHDGRHTGRR